jgi:dTDP-4-amino-4,6-dideoxygalactose transaminase
MKNSDIYVTRSSMPPYEEYIEAIKPLWDSHWITNMGAYHKQFEKELAEYLDVPELSLTVNGHTALELVIQSYNFPEGSEVITTPFTFISTTHAIVRNRLQPVFCDVKMSDGTMDEMKIEEQITEKTVAILPVHVYGHVCNTEAIDEIARKYGLKVIYDAAHAFGIQYHGKGIGNYGDASIFSFHATKVFHTIEGGAVVCRTHEMYQKIYDLKNFGIHGEELVTSVGANAKMNEFSAIMGICNLKYIDRAIASRKAVFEKYQELLVGRPGIRLLDHSADQTNNYAYYPILVEDAYGKTRDEIYAELKRKGIHPRKYFYPLTADQACFKNRYKKVEICNARWLSAHILLLPIYEGLEIKDVERIAESF